MLPLHYIWLFSSGLSFLCTPVSKRYFSSLLLGGIKASCRARAAALVPGLPRCLCAALQRLGDRARALPDPRPGTSLPSQTHLPGCLGAGSGLRGVGGCPTWAAPGASLWDGEMGWHGWRWVFWIGVWIWWWTAHWFKFWSLSLLNKICLKCIMNMLTRRLHCKCF